MSDHDRHAYHTIFTHYRRTIWRGFLVDFGLGVFCALVVLAFIAVLLGWLS